MRIFKVLGIVSCIFQVSWGANIEERCAQKLIAINDSVSIFERVNIRYANDKLVYEDELSRGFQNKTLEAEQLRDNSYLSLSREIITKLRELRCILSQGTNNPGNILEDALEYSQNLITRHDELATTTLMNFKIATAS